LHENIGGDALRIEQVALLSRPVGVGPVRARALAPELIGHRRKHFCADKPRRSVEIHHRVVHLCKTGGTINEHISAVDIHPMRGARPSR